MRERTELTGSHLVARTNPAQREFAFRGRPVGGRSGDWKLRVMNAQLRQAALTSGVVPGTTVVMDFGDPAHTSECLGDRPGFKAIKEVRPAKEKSQQGNQ